MALIQAAVPVVVAWVTCAIVAELKMARRRAALSWRLGPVERREAFYTSLLSSIAAAKEVRLFGIGTFLRHRMLAERRYADAARRRLDQRELRIRSGLGLTASAVAGAGLVTRGAQAHQQVILFGHYCAVVAAEPDLPVVESPVWSLRTGRRGNDVAGS